MGADGHVRATWWHDSRWLLRDPMGCGVERVPGGNQARRESSCRRITSHACACHSCPSQCSALGLPLIAVSRGEKGAGRRNVRVTDASRMRVARCAYCRKTWKSWNDHAARRARRASAGRTRRNKCRARAVAPRRRCVQAAQSQCSQRRSTTASRILHCLECCASATRSVARHAARLQHIR